MRRGFTPDGRELRRGGERVSSLTPPRALGFLAPVRRLRAPHAHAASSRSALIFGALLCLFAQTAGLAHVELAQHGICAEHGELTDLIPHGDAHAPRLDPHPDGVAGLHIPDVVTFSAADDHCVVAQLLRQLAPAPAVALIPAGLTSAGAVSSTERPALAARSPLHVAPKQSPPA